MTHVHILLLPLQVMMMKYCLLIRLRVVTLWGKISLRVHEAGKDVLVWDERRVFLLKCCVLYFNDPYFRTVLALHFTLTWCTLRVISGKALRHYL